MTPPRYEFYRVEIQRPVGDAWETVHVHQNAHGASPEEAARSVLHHFWPADIYSASIDGSFSARRHQVLAQADGYRMRLTPASHNRTGPREPVTLTLAEVELAKIRRLAAARKEARAALAAARKAYEDAKREAWRVDFDLGEAKREAALLKASASDIARAVRGLPPKEGGPT